MINVGELLAYVASLNCSDRAATIAALEVCADQLEEWDLAYVAFDLRRDAAALRTIVIRVTECAGVGVHDARDHRECA